MKGQGFIAPCLACLYLSSDPCSHPRQRCQQPPEGPRPAPQARRERATQSGDQPSRALRLWASAATNIGKTVMLPSGESDDQLLAQGTRQSFQRIERDGRVLTHCPSSPQIP